MAHVVPATTRGRQWASWSGKGYGWAQLTQPECMKNAVSFNSPLGLRLGQATFQARTLGISCDPLGGRCGGGGGIYGLNPETDSHMQSIWTLLYLEGVFLCYLP